MGTREPSSVTADVTPTTASGPSAIEAEALHQIAASTAVMMGVVELPADDSDIIQIYLSPATVHAFGITMAPTGPRTARGFGIAPDVIQCWTQHYREAQRTGKPVRFEYSHNHNHGEEPRWISALVAHVGDAPEGRTRFSYVMEDLTARKRAEAKLRDRELHLRLAMDASLAIAFEWDVVRNRVRRLTSAEEALPETGDHPDTLERVALVVHPDDRTHFLEMVRKACASSDGAYQSEFRVVRPSGEVRWLFETGRVEFDAAHQPLRLLGVSQDITERKRTEEALRESHRRKDEFIAVLAHELRNPLAPVRTAVEIMRLVGPADPRVERAREVIERQVSHMARLIDDLLDVSRIARGRLALQRQPCDLAAIARQTAEDYRVALEASGLTLEVMHTAESPLWVDGDPARLTQMIGNLLHNAGRFTPAGGRIEVSAVVAKDDIAQVKVRDTGVGMTPELLGRLFDPFAQAEQGLARTSGGLGLGLALTKGLAELHGGRVSAESAGPGQGSTFKLELPLSTQIRPPRPARDHDLRTVAPQRILVVEDHLDAANMLTEMLELSGHTVRVAHDGETALELARTFTPDTVLCDLGLPGALDGYAVAQALRLDPVCASTRLIALSGYADDDARRRSQRAGFDAHVAKPPDLALLKEALSSPTRKNTPPNA